VATYGFHSVTAVLALILLTCGRITLHLSHTNFTHSGLHDTDRINAEKAQKRWRAPAGREQGFQHHRPQRTEDQHTNGLCSSR
jgi:hypothetical protein